ncbi:MAG: Stp1/IreP family PP2C-type Ser/Thr phosphatase [Lachnospiraceae bacterium]|nr:Stp1/IreP family PP2C-type Ser/Thr phosphatase [Lachnospiraceae bacterium]
MASFSVTDIGKKRKLNQDFVYASDEPVGNLPNVYIVADGMGGHNAGDFASKCTVETITREIRGCFEKNAIRILSKAIMVANERIRQKAREDERLYGMGTTVVAATCIGKYLQVANVGDSRLYIINEEEVRQVTRDHSLVEEMVRMGGIDRKAARNHPDKNIITRAIGARDTIEIDFFNEELQDGDIVLMCSDGLSNMLEDEEIGKILRKKGSLEERAEKLVEAANNNGGKDNIAVIIIDMFADERLEND